MKKFLKLLPLVVVASLTACEKYKYSSNTLLVFGTVCNYTLQLTNDFAGGKTYSSIENILKDVDKYADATMGENGNFFFICFLAFNICCTFVVG